MPSSDIIYIVDCRVFNTLTGCGAVGSALPWGGRGRGFKSRHSDQPNAVSELTEAAYFLYEKIVTEQGEK